MDRSLWLSLLFVALSLALVLSGRAFLDISQMLRGADLVAQIERLDGQPSTVELADTVTEAAGCIRGLRPRVRSCWYAWADPSRPDYLRVVAVRVRDDATREASAFSAFAILFWVVVAFTTWKATRPRSRFRPGSPPASVSTDQPRGRSMP